MNASLPSTEPMARILIVDDDGQIRDLLASFFRQNGLEVALARDGTDMLAALDRQPIDLVVLDLMLPGAGGLDLCRDRFVTNEAVTDAAIEIETPSGTRKATLSLEGAFRAQEEASRTIGLLSLVSLAMVFAILDSRYRSVLFALVIMGSVPLALIGSVAALWWAGQPLSVASMIGFITLTGIAARNGILKVSHWINLAVHERMPFESGADMRALVTRGSLERPTPVLFQRYGAAPLRRLVDGVRADQTAAALARRDQPQSAEAF